MLIIFIQKRQCFFQLKYTLSKLHIFPSKIRNFEVFRDNIDTLPSPHPLFSGDKICAYVNAIMPSDQVGLARDFMLFFSGFIKYKLPSPRYIYITVHCITSTSTLYSKQNIVSDYVNLKSN